MPVNYFSDADLELFRRLWFAGCEIKDIGMRIGRSHSSIVEKAAKMGWPLLGEIRRANAVKIAAAFNPANYRSPENQHHNAHDNGS